MSSIHFSDWFLVAEKFRFAVYPNPSLIYDHLSIWGRIFSNTKTNFDTYFSSKRGDDSSYPKNTRESWCYWYSPKNWSRSFETSLSGSRTPTLITAAAIEMGKL